MLTRRLLAQLRIDQRTLYGAQDQVSTGRAFSLPSQNPQASVRALTIQRTLEYKEQYQVNLSTTESYLGASESAIAGVIDQLREAQSLVPVALNESTSAEQRQAIVEELDATLDMLVHAGNTQFRGRYLFNGRSGGDVAYEARLNQVLYRGDEISLSSLTDRGMVMPTNIAGDDLFGGFSNASVSEVELRTAVTEDTRLSDLELDEPIEGGWIRISDGVVSADVDLTDVRSIGDVLRQIKYHPPAGRSLDAEIRGDALRIGWSDSVGGSLSITDLNGGSVAKDLGIATANGPVAGEIEGNTLRPKFNRLTRLGDVLGIRASTVLQSLGDNNDIRIEARVNGTDSNGFRFQLVDDDEVDAGPAVSKGQEFVEFDAAARAARAGLQFSGVGNNIQLVGSTPGTDLNQVEIRVVSGGLIGDAASVSYDSAARRYEIAVDSTGATTIQTAIDAINAEGTFSASHDAGDPADGGFDPGALIQSGDINQVRSNTTQSGGLANTYYINVNPAVSTGADAVAALNRTTSFSGSFEASLDPLDRISGRNDGSGLLSFNDSAVSESGSGEALDLNGGLEIRVGSTTYDVSLREAETVEDLINLIHQAGAPVKADIDSEEGRLRLRSFASGVDFAVGENGGTTATQLGLRTMTESTSLDDLNFGQGIFAREGVDFTIVRNDGIEISVDVSNASTVGDVLSLINDHPDNQDADKIVAQMAVKGNGIELVDDNPPGEDTLRVEAAFGNQAAVRLGLIAVGETVGYPGGVPTNAYLDVSFSPPNQFNNSFRIEATEPGSDFNGVDLIIADGGAIGDTASAAYDPIAKTLTVTLDPSATQANTVIAAIQDEGTFSAELTETLGPNNGTGLIPVTGSLGLTSGGSSTPEAKPAEAKIAANDPAILNSALKILAKQGGTWANGVEIVFADTLAGDVASASYDGVARRLTIDIDSVNTTAQTLVDAVNLEGTFSAELDLETDPSNDGSGVPGRTGSVAFLDGGTAEVLSGRDVNMAEVSSVFNSLQKLMDALSGEVDYVEAERAYALLEEDFDRINHIRAELGAQTRAVDVLTTRLEEETVLLRTTLSEEIDADLVEAVSNLTLQQTAYQASLQMIGQSFQLTLLNFL